MFVLVVGFVALLYLTCRLVKLVYYEIMANFVHNIKDYVAKNAGSYAIVTGCTDGIGKAYAHRLASLGSNLILIGRGSRLVDVAKEISDQYTVEIVTLECDFSNIENVRKLETSLTKKDVSILINNVGMVYPGGQNYYDRIEIDHVDMLINVNCHSYSLLTRMVLPQMLKKKSGLIINVSSCSSFFAFPFMSLYASTKALVDTLTASLINEYPESEYGIHFHCLNPFFISSKMSRMKPSFFCPSPAVYAKSSLNYSLSNSGYSCGYWAHSLIVGFVSLLPPALIYHFSGKYSREIIEKIHQKKKE